MAHLKKNCPAFANLSRTLVSRSTLVSKIASDSKLSQKACLPSTGNGTLKGKIVTIQALVEEHLLVSFNNRLVPLKALSGFLSCFVKFLLLSNFVS